MKPARRESETMREKERLNYIFFRRSRYSHCAGLIVTSGGMNSEPQPQRLTQVTNWEEEEVEDHRNVRRWAAIRTWAEVAKARRELATLA